MYGALPTRPRLGLAPLPECPISALDDGLIVAIFRYLKPNHLRYLGQTLKDDGTVGGGNVEGYRCSLDNTVRMGELVSYVSIVELIQCSMVCRQWRRCAQLRALWEEADLSRFRDSVNDDLVLRIAKKAGRRLRSLCLNHCVKITDMSFYHLATHCPLIQELHFQGCPQLSAPAVLNLIRTLAYRNGLLRKPAVLALEMAKCAFLTPSVLEEIEKELFVAYKNAVATYRVRRANEAIEMSRRTDDRAAHAPAPAHAPLCSARARDGGVPSDQAWRQTIDLDVGLCILCNEIVDLSDGGGRCSLCTSLTCERCSDTPSTCELCCESFCNECRLVATCVACMKDYCDDCQEVLMCHDCDAVLCPECHADHQCETGTQISSLQPPQSAPPPASSDPYTARRNVSASADGQKSHIAKSLTAWVPQQPAHVYKCVSPRNPGSGGGAGVTATITMQPVLSHSA